MGGMAGATVCKWLTPEPHFVDQLISLWRREGVNWLFFFLGKATAEQWVDSAKYLLQTHYPLNFHALISLQSLGQLCICLVQSSELVFARGFIFRFSHCHLAIYRLETHLEVIVLRQSESAQWQARFFYQKKSAWSSREDPNLIPVPYKKSREVVLTNSQ